MIRDGAVVAAGLLLVACGLGRPPSPAVDAGSPPALDDSGADASSLTTSAPLPSPDELARLAEQTIRGGHAARVHDGRTPFSAALDLADGGCGRVVFVADQASVAVVGDSTGPRGDPVDAGAHLLSLVPAGGPVCAAAGAAVTLRVTAVNGSADVRWTTVTR